MSPPNEATVATLDLVVIAVYILLVVLLGLWAGRNEKDEEDYFLGGRSMPWLAVAISFYATTASALTFIGVPGAAFKGDWVYIQLGVGDLMGRFFIGWLLLPAYFGAQVTTVYQLLGVRFGPRSQDLGTLLFLATRVLASGVRLAACAVAFAVIFGTPLWPTIWAITAIAMIYTALGGIKAVIWTDTLQFVLFVGGALVALGVILNGLPEGFDTFLEIGRANDKFRIFHLDKPLNDPQNIVAGTMFGMLLTFAVQGTDQDMVQRLLTTRTLGESQKALFLTALMNLPMNVLFLSLGAGLFAYYQTFPDPQVTTYVAQGHADYVFPHFIRTVLGPGLRGLLMAGLLAAAMSSLDSALSALSSTAYIDLYQKYIEPGAKPARALQISRRLAFMFAGVLGVVAMLFGQWDGVLWIGFKIMGLTYGTLLGLFLLATLTTNRGSDTGNIVAVVISLALVLYLTAQPPYGTAWLAWTWSILVGTVSTFVIGALWATPTRPD